MSESALAAARRGLDVAQALGIGATQFDATLYAQTRDLFGSPAIGARAEVLHRISKPFSVGASVYAEREIGGQSRPDFGAQLFLRGSFP